MTPSFVLWGFFMFDLDIIEMGGYYIPIVAYSNERGLV